MYRYRVFSFQYPNREIDALTNNTIDCRRRKIIARQIRKSLDRRKTSIKRRSTAVKLSSVRAIRRLNLSPLWLRACDHRRHKSKKESLNHGQRMCICETPRRMQEAYDMKRL
ncbi:hypothetical protein HII31_01896 [Pseudocercospora fuligena]|uniref:Uncharacterized protein n=1 Tax=Pseudocercospora fuligena TaxID=685502 RepID=A0A8H6RSZ6_9PEZI|nr:hypothetical protein HII31_01896 [Pseudocercospora fuligena]